MTVCISDKQPSLFGAEKASVRFGGSRVIDASPFDIRQDEVVAAINPTPWRASPLIVAPAPATARIASWLLQKDQFGGVDPSDPVRTPAIHLAVLESNKAGDASPRQYG
jgi:hypothetical protein